MSALTAALDRVEGSHGSTRAVSLIRIGLAFLMWSRMAKLMVPFAEPQVNVVFAGAFFTLTTLMAIGWRSQLTSAATGLLLFYAYYALGRRGFDLRHHHVYLLASVSCLLALTPCGGSWSLDRWLALRRGASVKEDGPLWALNLLRLQVSAVYLFSALDKSNAEWLSGMRLEQYFMLFYAGSDYPRVPGFGWLMFAGAWGSVALEYALATGLWFRRALPWLVPMGIVFHVLIYLTLPVHTFSLTTLLLYLAFIPPETIHRFFDRMHGDLDLAAHSRSGREAA